MLVRLYHRDNTKFKRFVHISCISGRGWDSCCPGENASVIPSCSWQYVFLTFDREWYKAWIVVQCGTECVVWSLSSVQGWHCTLHRPEPRLLPRPASCCKTDSIQHTFIRVVLFPLDCTCVSCSWLQRRHLRPRWECFEAFVWLPSAVEPLPKTRHQNHRFLNFLLLR